MKDLSMHVMDLAENSIRAGADLIEIEINEDCQSGYLVLSIKDNGKGLKEGQADSLLDPFFTTKEGKRVGLGLSLFEQTCVRCGGRLKIMPGEKGGLWVEGTMRLDSIDLPPYGDLGAAISGLLLLYGGIDLQLSIKRRGRVLRLDTRDIRKAEEIGPGHMMAIRDQVRSYLNQ